jgi:hypothetical protein
MTLLRYRATIGGLILMRLYLLLLVLVAAIPTSIALVLTRHVYLLLLRDPTQTDQVIWVRTAALWFGAISTLMGLVATFFALIRALSREPVRW